MFQVSREDPKEAFYKERPQESRLNREWSMGMAMASGLKYGARLEGRFARKDLGNQDTGAFREGPLLRLAHHRRT